MTKPELQEVWRFVRRDTTPKAFEHWVCADAAPEEMFGRALYLELISANYPDNHVVHELKRRLDTWARTFDDLVCHCARLADLSVVDMGSDTHEEVFDTLGDIVVRGDPIFWLFAQVCSACGDRWLIAQEEHNDVFCMRRLSADEWLRIQSGQSWPTDFDKYEDLLRIGRDAGKSVRFLEPMNSSLSWTIQYLAKERPRIRVSELATLLNLEPDIASSLARRAVSDHQVVITFDAE